MILGMIFLLFFSPVFSPKKMIHSHHFGQVKMIYSGVEYQFLSQF